MKLITTLLGMIDLKDLIFKTKKLIKGKKPGSRGFMPTRAALKGLKASLPCLAAVQAAFVAFNIPQEVPIMGMWFHLPLLIAFCVELMSIIQSYHKYRK